MAGKRKRKRPGAADEGDQKRQKVAAGSNAKEPVVKQALLNQYYPEVLSLKEYLLANLPSTSKIRRRKISSIGRKPEDKESDRKLCQFLENSLIGVCKNRDLSQDERWSQWTTFSQKPDDSTSFANLSTSQVYSQSEIIDFGIWLIFLKNKTANGKVQHLLCQGFQKNASARHMNEGEHATSAIPGVISTYPNDHVTSMKAWPWPQVLALLGKQGERMMIDLILDCGIFLPVEDAYGSYYQLSGQPLGDLRLLGLRPQPKLVVRKDIVDKRAPRTPSNINFVRSRMMYARAATNIQGDVHFGFRYNHLLNRWPLRKKPPEPKNGPQQNTPHERSTLQVMMYMFPRQYGLHNVFTCDVDPWQTMQPFKDYTLRDDEIISRFPGDPMPKIPKRLRGRTVELVRKLQISHRRCPYKILVDGQASRVLSEMPLSTNDSTKPKTQMSASTATSSKALTQAAILARKSSMMDHATPTAMVSAFCRAVLARLVPLGFWGTGDIAKQNQKAFEQNINTYVHLQRFANFSLHHVTQGIKISDINWLGPAHTARAKLAQSDTQKRWEIFHEFLYYLFDSLLIPLIRANFHVTESNVAGSRLFYFRHDVWRTIAEPALTSLKSTMFEEVKKEQALKLLESRDLGYSQVRLVPKETGVRPIMNLRRRQPKIGNKNRLGSSINTVLAPVYNVLTMERFTNPARLGSTMFSTGDLYQRLRAFKSKLSTTKGLYFAKVDVQAAFDTIPQAAVVALISSVPSEAEYRILKYVQIKPNDNYRENIKGKPIQKWTALAKSLDDCETFAESLEELAVGKKNTIFVENIVSQFRDTDEILNLLSEHVQRNMVKVGKKFYRQKEGIPQGSVISSLLCNYFYADLEDKHLSFLKSENTLLLRLIDDFLLITTNHSHAKRFLQTMHDGLPSYGVRVNPDKTLVNFEVTINNKKVPRMVGKAGFPYCGSFIDTKTLDISRDRERKKNKAVVDSLTVECSRTPGRMFHRKMLNTFKIQAHAMFLDTSFNSLKTVLTNVYSAFIESATKLWTYAKCLPVGKQPRTKLVIKTISDLIELAFVLMKSKGKNRRNVGYGCKLSKVQVEWLAANAFQKVLRKRQSKFGKVLEWLVGRIKMLRMREGETCRRMEGVVRTASVHD
ncbi:related to telomerase reverse transcriptase [Phialocephala subalpina]|uniref:Telomerase reverse transcriptase n=1 Tax=Phialocephala subalpina TaxID=576137 RepID=A0A1L7WEY5_9HELO|nr:related to telomerase reverse transcriptase [Phialocephala subalpina]